MEVEKCIKAQGTMEIIITEFVGFCVSLAPSTFKTKAFVYILNGENLQPDVSKDQNY